MTLPLRIELAMTLKADFPGVLAAFRTGIAGLSAMDAVSGRNILILRPDASILGNLTAFFRAPR
jgi:hypothetical protein